MKPYKRLFLIFVLSLCAAASHATTLAVHLVELTSAGNSSPALTPYVNNLRRFHDGAFELRERQNVTLPAQGRVSLQAGLHLSLSGNEQSLQVTVGSGQQTLMNTQLRFAPGVPVTLGPFHHGGRRYVLILVTDSP